ncbi:UNKNOWN [Stylonychia lemnae]|uniref:Derlin n=1 Tax=Stylonychia lemnae TaxID=5949 RepID=A0A078A1G8_STYLE|nr:UNKNOWN [Stylonychia lemnae]|eukprot:CDW75945.1 UNKNOWN [Stylonychia lemnae]
MLLQSFYAIYRDIGITHSRNVYSWIYGYHYLLTDAFKFSVLYVQCKNEPDRPMSIWGFPVVSGNLPWVLVLLSILTGGDPFESLIGIAAGHTYIFLKITLPNSHGYNLLKTPVRFEKLVNEIIRRSNVQNPGPRVQGLGGARVEMGGAVGQGGIARAFAGRGVRLGGQ